MFEEFEKKKYQTQRPPPTDISDFVLVEKRKMEDFKCGECDGKMYMSIYYCSSPSRYIKQIKCSKCNLETWR
ncbi:MAG: hypothetical protein HWN67_01640 [Candidatus Helarchaeota archaeon]|nr:hypothetical protein [Candidatus Helarchaeota archaeon]